ncbi:hypothetical protein MHU86_2715 [Fragilaria crotonensis]|nr:hypothetical protein MHU86_2715 [Fragilaria crotonensis]
MYWDPVGSFPFEQKLFGRWIGVAEVSTDLMAFYILTRSGKVIVRKSVWGLSEDDLANPDIKLRLSELDEGIQSKIGDGLKTEDIDPDLMDSMPEVPDDVSVHISFLLLCNRLIAHSLLSTVVDMHDACATPTSLA